MQKNKITPEPSKVLSAPAGNICIIDVLLLPRFIIVDKV